MNRSAPSIPNQQQYRIWVFSSSHFHLYILCYSRVLLFAARPHDHFWPIRTSHQLPIIICIPLVWAGSMKERGLKSVRPMGNPDCTQPPKRATSKYINPSLKYVANEHDSLIYALWTASLLANDRWAKNQLISLRWKRGNGAIPMGRSILNMISH